MAETPAFVTLDANQAAASVAYRVNEVAAIYPITPSSPMGEWCDEWATQGKPNVWGEVPEIAEMQSEAGAAGAVHGALQSGALTTTFTGSQGLLLMIPNLYKIAGELTPFCMHVAARTVATHALSIFGDHSDIYAARQTGMALLSSNNVQEAHDLACIGQSATLASRIPVLHFFDGFRTSHEIARIAELSDADLRAMIDPEAVRAHRARALTPDRPAIRGTAQNPDAFFQAREAVNPYYDAAPDLIQDAMDRFAERTGRAYRLFDYVGHPQAERVVVMMGSGAEAAHEAVEQLAEAGERVGLIKARLLRPFSSEHFLAALPASARAVAALDRTKEPGASAEPLHQEIGAALMEAAQDGRIDALPRLVGGRYGLSGKELRPSMVKSVLDELASASPRNHFTLGITDDVTGRSLPEDPDLDTERDDVVRAVFYGLGSDGTVGANKNSIKIIGEHTNLHVQGSFVYDSKKSGARTISHLRFGPRPIRSTYQIRSASFVACHQFEFLKKYRVLEHAAPGATFLLNAPYGPEAVWDHLPREAQEAIREKALRFFVIDASAVARDAGLGGRINTVMQACFFRLSGAMPVAEALEHVKESIRATYGRKGDEIVRRNVEAVDRALENLHEVVVPNRVTATAGRPPVVSAEAPDFVQRVTSVLMSDQGDLLPVSAFPVDGTWPLSTSRWEKRNVAAEIPIWDPDVCIQCNKCALVCPHTAIRAKAYDPDHLADAPEGFQAADYKASDLKGLSYTLQVAPEDCTGCHLCVMVCPAKDKSQPKRKAINMAPHDEHVARERENFGFFEKLPHVSAEQLKRVDAKGSQFLQPLFESSGACAGCGETPYVRLLTQLFGDRALIANATGCSSIYGGNLPTTPYATDGAGRGPAWSNSLFEDNAEFGFGFRLAVSRHERRARSLLEGLAPEVGEQVAETLAGGAALPDKREAVAALRASLGGMDGPAARELHALADYLVPKSIWLVGGDGWAYDIGFGGLDHVLASGRDVNVLVLDTEVYSNTGGQQSKATPLGAAAKFAAAGKGIHKKDLGLMAMSYGHVYVASVAFGAKDNQTVQALREAESYPGPSLIIAYSHCIAHGYDLRYGAEQQNRAVRAGAWPLFRFDPRRIERDEPPLQLDNPPAKGSLREYMANEGRFRMVEKIDPDRFKRLGELAKRHNDRRLDLYRQLAELHIAVGGGEATGAAESEHAREDDER